MKAEFKNFDLNSTLPSADIAINDIFLTKKPQAIRSLFYFSELPLGNPQCHFPAV